MHVLLAPLPLASSCESVDDVLARLMQSTMQVLGVAVGSVISSVGVLLSVLVVVVEVVPCNFASWGFS